MFIGELDRANRVLHQHNLLDLAFAATAALVVTPHLCFDSELLQQSGKIIVVSSVVIITLGQMWKDQEISGLPPILLAGFVGFVSFVNYGFCKVAHERAMDSFCDRTLGLERDWHSHLANPTTQSGPNNLFSYEDVFHGVCEAAVKGIFMSRCITYANALLRAF